MIIHMFVSESVSKVNLSDTRIAMSPLLRGESTVRFWSQVLSWISVYYNYDKIKAYYTDSNTNSLAFQLWKRYERECLFIMIQWITICEVKFNILIIYCIIM